jgi:hypothetical protein
VGGMCIGGGEGRANERCAFSAGWMYSQLVATGGAQMCAGYGRLEIVQQHLRQRAQVVAAAPTRWAHSEISRRTHTLPSSSET